LTYRAFEVYYSAPFKEKLMVIRRNFTRDTRNGGPETGWVASSSGTTTLEEANR